MFYGIISWLSQRLEHILYTILLQLMFALQWNEGLDSDSWLGIEDVELVNRRGGEVRLQNLIIITVLRLQESLVVDELRLSEIVQIVLV